MDTIRGVLSGSARVHQECVRVGRDRGGDDASSARANTEGTPTQKATHVQSGGG